MTPPLRIRSARPLALASCLLLGLLASPLAHSQGACSSDGQPLPTALFERFINADCDSCWRDTATPAGPPGALALDWIVPGSQGDDAPLATAASTDALARLAERPDAPPATQTQQVTAIKGWPKAALRVAHGPAVGDYMGVLIALSLPHSNALALPLSGWVVLLEELPAGTEGSVVPRYLVRNALQPLWNKVEKLSNQETLSFNDVRAMGIAQGADARRLRVASWVQDANGQVLTAVQSGCPPED